MKIFIYYESNKTLNAEPDVAVVKASNLNEATEILNKYYQNVCKHNVRELTFKDFNNNDTNIMIISDY